VNGDRIFISSQNNSQIEVVNISDKDNPSQIANIETSATVNDFDIKGSFYEDSTVTPSTYQLKTYLYSATNNGLKRFDVTDAANPIELAAYKTENSFYKIEISNPYAYVESNIADGLSILYIKRPASTPKLKGSVYWGDGSISLMNIHQDNAYIINDSNVVSIIDISDQTAPKKVDIPYMEAKGFTIGQGVGYFVKNTSATPSIYNFIYAYDMSNDYSDVKGKAAVVKYDLTNYGLISEYRTDDNDVFYINAERSTQFNFSAQGDIPIAYRLYELNSDTIVTSFGASGLFTASTSETNTSVTLDAGEYYIKISSPDLNTSGSYQFDVAKIEDDFADTFLYSDMISIGDSTEAKILTSEDKDVVKIELSERGEFDFNATDGIKVTLLYDDTITTLSNNSNAINTTLNPGTYYVVMESNGTFVGDYVFESTFNSSGELAMPDGFDGRDNYNAEYVIYGDRYIYVIEPDNHVAVYNHLLQAVAREMSADGSVDYSNNCGKPFYYDTKLYINKTYIENGTATCKEYASISVENTDSHFEYESMGYSEIYYDNINSVSITDRSIINIDNDYVYEFSKSEGSIFKTLYSEIDKRDEYSQYVYKRAYGHITGMTNLNDIKALKNDENIDVVAVNSNISIYKTNPDSPVSHTYQVYDEYGYPVYDELNNPVYDTYIDYEPILIGTKTFPVSGNVIDMHIDRESDVVYVLNENSTNITLINYDINDVTLSASTSVDIGVQASGMFIKENKIY
ncbi:MAG: hypothetical protein OQJ77_06120, partial [Thiovulaceae bacterium]|nr:hypothetical protein [Sulfurimonadaceae bacterium]